MSTQSRLKKCMQGGNLRVADLARWFERPHATVREWVEQGREPAGGPLDVEHAHALLDLLEQLVRRKAGFPLPRLSPTKRIEHLAAIRKKALP